jgi:hypothetical protein
MAPLSAVSQATLAFINGELSADEVIAKVKPSSPPPKKSVEQVVSDTTNDVRSVNPPNGFRDVQIYWGMMTPEQKAEIRAARERAGV